MDFQVDDFDSLRRALSFFDDFFRQNGVGDESIFDSHLVLCELAANVLRHSQGVATVIGEIVDRKIEVEVRSTEPFDPPKKSELPDCCAEGGRGLYLVDTVSERRFVTSAGGIRVVIRTEYR